MAIRTLIVDDSALMRRALKETLERDPDIVVVGTAVDAYAARHKILTLHPDVVTLDIDLPRMNGMTFLKLLMRHHPLPVVVISSHASKGTPFGTEIMEAGAVDLISKDEAGDSAALAARIKAAARCGERTVSVPPHPNRLAGPVIIPRVQNPEMLPLILMGASTGGTEALRDILTVLPAGLPPICIVQHIPAHFSRALAERLDAACALRVSEAKGGDVLDTGHAYIAPGGFHLLIRKIARGMALTLSEAPQVHHQRPSIDVLFDSAVKAGLAPRTLALLLTGMGVDGASGLLRLRQAGAATAAQDERSCVVYGMPKEAARLGAAQRVVPLEGMAGEILRFSARRAAADPVAVRG